MSVAITNVTLSKNSVKTKEQFKISVAVKEIVSEPMRYRLSFRCGQPKGNLGGYNLMNPEPKMYSLPFSLGDKQGGGF